MIAAIHGNLDAMKVALNAGADANHEDIVSKGVSFCTGIWPS
jgi:hypothetical protein